MMIKYNLIDLTINALTSFMNLDLQSSAFLLYHISHYLKDQVEDILIIEVDVVLMKHMVKLEN